MSESLDMQVEFPPMVFLDLETSGATATRDRITEIGFIEVSQSGVRRHSQLLNPQCKIPEFIQNLTGISQQMVADAPTFKEIASDIFDQLHGRLFVAHNARFDYGFLKQEFKRVGIDFRARVLCTVKLSRALYPEETRHNLDTLIERHGLVALSRHRAMADADLIYQFWQKMLSQFPAARLSQMIAQLTAHAALPSHLDQDLPEELPESPGVYIFYGENDFPLYVGKSKNLRKRVLSHFSSDASRAKEMSLSLQVRRIDWQETCGEIAALLRESVLVKELLPSHNTRLRRNKELCSWRIAQDPHNDAAQDPHRGAHHDAHSAPHPQPELVWARDLHFGSQPDLYGLFKSQRDAQEMLAELAQKEKLCKAALGLEKTKPGAPCFGYQLKQCHGVCVGKEKPHLHYARLMSAVSRHHMPAWSFDGPVGLREGDELHIVDAWCYLGSAKNEEDVFEILDGGKPVFDLDTFKILRKAFKQLPVVLLASDRSQPLGHHLHENAS